MNSTKGFIEDMQRRQGEWPGQTVPLFAIAEGLGRVAKAIEDLAPTPTREVSPPQRGE